MFKNKLIVMILIVSVWLTGCGVLNLTGYILPDDLEFLAVVEELDTPKKIGDYMLENFTYEIHLYYTPNPYYLWKNKKGDCNDFSTFGIFVANWHGYETYQIYILFKNPSEEHFLGVYVEDKLSYTDNRNYFYGFGTFLDVVLMDSLYQERQLKSCIVYNYEMNIVEEMIF